MKPVKHRLIRKRINIRVEHVRPSRSREDFLRRVKSNDEKKRAAKAAGTKVQTKRLPQGPKKGFVVEINEETAPETMRPLAFDYYI